MGVEMQYFASLVTCFTEAQDIALYILYYFCRMADQINNPLHGKTLETILNELVAHYDWPELGYLIRINCFLVDPSVKSSLKFLRKTAWARKKVEDLYVDTKFNKPAL